MKKKSLLMIPFIIGLILVLMTFLEEPIGTLIGSSMIQAYDKKASENLWEEKKEEAILYNKTIQSTDVHALLTAYQDQVDERYLSIQDLHNGMISYVTFDEKLSVPVFHTKNKSIFSFGLTHLPGTSFPTGTKSTHAVFTLSTGIGTKRAQNKLKSVSVGDLLSVNVYGENRTYRVEEVCLLEDNDYSKLQIEKGQELISFLIVSKKETMLIKCFYEPVE